MKKPSRTNLAGKFGCSITRESAKDGIPTFWIDRSDLLSVLRYLKGEAAIAFPGCSMT